MEARPAHSLCRRRNSRTSGPKDACSSAPATASLPLSSGPAGLDIFAREPVEAVVLDFLNARHDRRRSRRLHAPDKPDIPILMLSAYTSLPPEVKGVVDLSMTKGEGAPRCSKSWAA